MAQPAEENILVVCAVIGGTYVKALVGRAKPDDAALTIGISSKQNGALDGYRARCTPYQRRMKPNTKLNNSAAIARYCRRDLPIQECMQRELLK